MTPQAFAFFDFDGTLCKGDSILPYLLYAVRHQIAPKEQLFSALQGYLGQRMDPGQVVHAKELTLSFIKGRSVSEMDDFAKRFIRDVLVQNFFPEGLARLKELRSQGIQVVIVSASPDVYMRMLPSFMPVDAVIATPCEVSGGIYTGRIACNCKGEEKPRLIQEWLRRQGLMLDPAASWAFGDSASDAPMLLMTEHPVAVNPKPKLLKAVPSAAVVQWRPRGKE